MIAVFGAHVPAFMFVCAAVVSSADDLGDGGKLLMWLCTFGTCWAYHRYGQEATKAPTLVVEPVLRPVSGSLRDWLRAWWRELNYVPGDVRQGAPSSLPTSESAAGTKASGAPTIQSHSVQPPTPATSAAKSECRAPEIYLSAAVEPIQLPDTISFRYRKADGTQRRRTVTAFQVVDIGGRAYMDAHDHDRKATRSFLISRIVGEVTRSESGEVMSAASWLSAVAMVTDSTRRKERGRRKSATWDWQTAVVFAGLHPARSDALGARALEAGWDVRERIMRSVSYVVAGPLMGHKQRERAEALRIPMIDEDTAIALMSQRTEGQ
ncbi:WYL domain-containing protein [Ralstonia pickettii]|nr:WYL domain-containing protein [Ralstonia pickettii]